MRLGNALLNDRLVACVHQTAVDSSFWWDRKIDHDHEVLLMMESVEEKFDAIESTVTETSQLRPVRSNFGKDGSLDSWCREMAQRDIGLKAIILDIDGTLTPTVSWLAFTEGLGGNVSEHSRIFEDFKNGKTTYTDAKKELIELWRATGKADRVSVTKQFESWELFPGVEEAVAMLVANYKVCLITVHLTFRAEVLAKRLDITNWYANTTLHWDSDDVIVDMDYTLDQATKKLEHLNQYCKDQGISPEGCMAVGDSDNDVKLFEATRNGMAVGDAPEELLMVSATKLGSITELPDLLGLA